jgi:hypothetical protein
LFQVVRQPSRHLLGRPVACIVGIVVVGPAVGEAQEASLYGEIEVVIAVTAVLDVVAPAAFLPGGEIRSPRGRGAGCVDRGTKLQAPPGRDGRESVVDETGGDDAGPEESNEHVGVVDDGLGNPVGLVVVGGASKLDEADEAGPVAAGRTAPRREVEDVRDGRWRLQPGDRPGQEVRPDEASEVVVAVEFDEQLGKMTEGPGVGEESTRCKPPGCCVANLIQPRSVAGFAAYEPAEALMVDLQPADSGLLGDDRRDGAERSRKHRCDDGEDLAQLLGRDSKVADREQADSKALPGGQATEQVRVVSVQILR